MARQGNAPADDLPFALLREGRHGPVIHAVTRAARAAGVVPGSRVADMRALCPDLQLDYADLAGDRAALDRLVLWARRWCPWNVRDGDDGIILDTTGADHLWGGEAAMLVEIEAELSRLGLSARLAVAPTWGAAWALARYGPVRAICSADELPFKIGPLPVAGLRLTAESCLLLRRLGLSTIGAVLDVPRLSLTRRFVKAPLPENPMLRCDQAMGRLAEPVCSIDALPPIRAQARLAEPIFDPSPHLPELCEKLCAQLAEQGQGCRHVTLSVFRTDGDVVDVQFTTSAPSRDPAHILGVFRDRVEKINPGFGFDLIMLSADQCEPLHARQPGLGGEPDDDLALPRLIDRLSAKFGAHRVTRPVLRQSHLPERAEAQVAAAAGLGDRPQRPVIERPLRLLDHPEELRVTYRLPEGPPAQFVWRRQTHRVARFTGPERIAPEWWHDRPGTRLRDYFKVENHAGLRLWLYREGVHGDGRGAAPRWFVHGFFA